MEVYYSIFIYSRWRPLNLKHHYRNLNSVNKNKNKNKNKINCVQKAQIITEANFRWIQYYYSNSSYYILVHPLYNIVDKQCIFEVHVSLFISSYKTKALKNFQQTKNWVYQLCRRQYRWQQYIHVIVSIESWMENCFVMNSEYEIFENAKE